MWLCRIADGVSGWYRIDIEQETHRSEDFSGQGLAFFVVWDEYRHYIVCCQGTGAEGKAEEEGVGAHCCIRI